MANLEVAADELVRKLKAVDDEVEEARQGISRLKGQVDSLGDELDDEWIEVARAVSELVEKAQEEVGTLGSEAQETTQAVANVEPMGQSAQQAAEAGLGAAEQGTTAFGDAVNQRGPQVDSAAEAGEQTFQALSQQAEEVSSNLEEVLQQARDFLTGGVVSAFETMQAEISDRFDEMRTTLTQECTTALQEAYDNWSEKLDEVLSTVEEEGFTAAQAQGEEVVEWALTETATGHEQELERLLQVVGVVQEALQTLRDESIGESRTDVGEEGRNALAQALAETETALLGMIAALDACRQTMSDYSFIQL
jgi:ABC-type transporter Mla subunit MlaD